MAAHNLGAFVRFESTVDRLSTTAHIKRPESILPKGRIKDVMELDDMSIGGRVQRSGSETPTAELETAVVLENPIPVELGDLEMSRPQPPTTAEETEVVQTWSNPSMNKWRVLSACLVCFGNGCNDSAPGALLPYIERHYQIDYALVSLIFVATAVGFIVPAFFVHAIDSKLGRARTLMLCEVLTILGYVLLVTTPAFPAYAIGYFISAYGMATGLALNNVFCANLGDATVILGMFHGCYGIGGVVAPIIATTMVTNGVLFSRFYLITLGIRIACLICCGWAFWHFERDSPSHSTRLSSIERTASGQHHTDGELAEQPSKMRQLQLTLKNRTTLIGALFIFGYQGAEVTISGWVISFLISYRGGDPAKVGYVTAGFWAGIALGRFLLSPFAHRLGERLSVCLLVLGALAFQLLVWLVPNAVGDAVAVSIVGLLLGPVYPCATTVLARLLPRSLQHSAMAFVSSAGSSGGAAAPFATGLLAQVSGTWVLHPVCIGLFVLMEGCWWWLERGSRKRKE